MKHINESKDNNYIIVVPTISIANINHNAFNYKEDYIKLCTNDEAFKNNNEFDSNVRVIIIMYHTASRCLDSIIESTHETLLNKHRLYIDNAHLLRLHPAIIEMKLVTNYVGLITTSPRELKHLAVFKEYFLVRLSVTTHYQRKLLINILTNLSFQYNEEEYKQMQCNYY